MKNILIIADGDLSELFLKELAQNHSNLHFYTIVSKKKLNINSENFKIYNFDATSFSKLKMVTDNYFSQFNIINDNKQESIEIYANLRKISKTTEIIFLNLWDIDAEFFKDDRHINIVNANEILVSNFMNRLPDTPVFANNIGFDDGEIMEIKVPVGSSYLYRHIRSIKQKKWRIALIYRQNELVFPDPSVTIQPNDILLIVGNPNVLRNVFNSIKREKGQFPNPFGNNIYTFIDMRLMSDNDVKRLIDDSLYLHSKLKNKRLIFKVINPTLCENLEFLKAIDDKSVVVKIDYFVKDNSHIQGDVANFDVGLLVSINGYFFKFRQFFHSLDLPILKLGKIPFSSIKNGVILADEKENIEKHSSVILDSSSQLGLDMTLHYFDSKNSDFTELAEHFESLNTLFNKTVKIQSHKDKNPLLELWTHNDLLHFIPFSKHISKIDHFAFLTPDLNYQFKLLKNNSQLFMPVS